MRYSENDTENVADERWQKNTKNVHWLPIFVHDPLPFAATLWARTAEIGISAIFVVMSFTASLLFEELVNRADDMNENYATAPPNYLPAELEKWRRHFDLVCTFVKKINRSFGLVLALQTALAFAIPIFEFYKILMALVGKGIIDFRYNFAFIHTMLRFHFLILVPSYFVAQQVR